MKKIIIICISVLTMILSSCGQSDEKKSNSAVGEWKTVSIEKKLETIENGGHSSRGLIYFKLSDGTVIKLKAPFSDNELIIAFKDREETITYRANSDIYCEFEFKE